MNRPVYVYALILTLSLLNYPLAAETAVDDEPPPTVITADSIQADFKAKRAVYTGNVHVQDDRVDLRSDKLVVHFDQADQLKLIEADGNVMITRAENIAIGGKAEYDLGKGKITLFDFPILVQGKSRITGAERVIYDVKGQKAWTEAGTPRMDILPETKGKNLGDYLKKSRAAEKKKLAQDSN